MVHRISLVILLLITSACGTIPSSQEPSTSPLQVEETERTCNCLQATVSFSKSEITIVCGAEKIKFHKSSVPEVWELRRSLDNQKVQFQETILYFNNNSSRKLYFLRWDGKEVVFFFPQ